MLYIEEVKESEPKSSGTKHVVQAEISHVSKILFLSNKC